MVNWITMSGAELGSRTLSFEPSQVRGGAYHFAVGTASATLVLQTVLPALLLAGEASRLTAKGELSIVRERLGIERASCRIEDVPRSVGPGNVLMIVIESESVSEVITAFGVKGVTAEQVAADACDEAEAHIAGGTPIGIHLADQLLIPMALAGGGAFRCLEPTAHAVTNADVIRRFLDVPIAVEREHESVYRVTVGSAVGEGAS